MNHSQLVSKLADITGQVPRRTTSQAGVTYCLVQYYCLLPTVLLGPVPMAPSHPCKELGKHLAKVLRTGGHTRLPGRILPECAVSGMGMAASAALQTHD